MRLIRLIFLASLAVVLMTLSLANRGMVTLTLLPAEIGGLIGINSSIELPLFLVIFAGIVLGILIGFVWEYLREYKHRSAAGSANREAARLAREVDRLRTATNDGQDEILALLDAPTPAK